ncbi:MAG: arsenate reductase (glutaredoxin) [Alphaproteobacteria bacterium MedPE-SWcel]|nr:MAG: arsenate reductase (glutaredoxin) [Alphaproteobacteria bacterium MedPE-SWcel]
MNIVIHHNPRCGTSRNVLQLVRDAGYDPVVVDYLETGWTRPQLLALFAAAGLTPRMALRTTKSPAAELGLLEESVSDSDILDQMVLHSILVNRPIVACPRGVKLCRPSGRVLDLLDTWPAGPWAKEDGTLILDADGSRVGE